VRRPTVSAESGAPRELPGLPESCRWPTPPARGACEASEHFCDDLLQDVPVETEARYRALHLVVLFAKLTQFAQLVQAQARILLLLQVNAQLADPMLAANLTRIAEGDRSAAVQEVR
jgi:hypothetical protein